jgi:hypothetical protein
MKKPDWINKLLGRSSNVSVAGDKMMNAKTREANDKMNLIKIREMRDLLEFSVGTDDKGNELLSPKKNVYGFEKSEYYPHELRKNIEPWLTALLQSEHLSLLVGAGLTTAVHKNITDELPVDFGIQKYSVFENEINTEMTRMAKVTGRGEPNQEDQLRTALKIYDGLRILLSDKKNPPEEPWKTFISQSETLKKEVDKTIEKLIENILKTENNISFIPSESDSISEKVEKRDNSLSMLVSFLMTFASRTGTRDRLGIFTTNYDRLIEFGAELAGIRLIDRFLGNLSPVFRSSRLDVDLHYNPPGIRGEPRYLEGVARFTKLHGSLDWIDDIRHIRRVALPFGTVEYEKFVPSGIQQVLIYPKDAKDRETAEYPYVELFRDFAAALCRPNSTLVTYGYSFGDQHINRVIQDMLTIPSTHLVMINYSDTGNRLTKFFHDSKRVSQISLLIGNHIGNLSNLVDYYLPKPAIDRASIRMADLLKARGFGKRYEEDAKNISSTSESSEEEQQ